MERITTRRVIVKTIEEEVEMDIFVSKDGIIFDTEEECLKRDEQMDFLSYFEKKFKLRKIDPEEYGLNFGHTIYCHLIYIEKLSDKVINEFIRYYELKDYPDDIIKIKEGWSFVAHVSDVNLWVFDKTDRLFTIESLDDLIKIKKREITLLTELI